MTISSRLGSRRDRAEDVGTLWTMDLWEHQARCGLFARRNRWEVRVLVGRDLLLKKRCARAADAFSIAERCGCACSMTDGGNCCRLLGRAVAVPRPADLLRTIRGLSRSARRTASIYAWEPPSQKAHALTAE